MTHPRLGVSAVLVVLFLATHPQNATACDCVQQPQSCRFFKSAAAVFIGTVDASNIEGQEVRIRFRDVRRLRGASQDVVVNDLSDCAYPFVGGRRYLVAADRRADGRLTVTLCGLTQPAETAQDALEYLRTLDQPSTGGQIWGTVKRQARWIEFSVQYEPIAAARVTLSGPVTRSTTTTSDGRYRIVGLPAGQYTMRVTLPSTSYLEPIGEQPVRFDAAYDCAAVDAIAPIASRISGTVIDDRLRPQGGIFLMLYAAGQRDSRPGIPGIGATTDAQGRYEFRDVPPGQYVVVVSDPRTLASVGSGVDDTIVALELGQRVTVPPIRLKRPIRD